MRYGGCTQSRVDASSVLLAQTCRHVVAATREMKIQSAHNVGRRMTVSTFLCSMVSRVETLEQRRAELAGGRRCVGVSRRTCTHC